MNIYRLCPNCLAEIQIKKPKDPDCNFIYKSGKHCQTEKSSNYFVGGATCCNKWFCCAHKTQYNDDDGNFEGEQEKCPDCEKKLDYQKSDKLKCNYVDVFRSVCDGCIYDYGDNNIEGAVCCERYYCYDHKDEYKFCPICGLFLNY